MASLSRTRGMFFLAVPFPYYVCSQHLIFCQVADARKCNRFNRFSAEISLALLLLVSYSPDNSDFVKAIGYDNSRAMGRGRKETAWLNQSSSTLRRAVLTALPLARIWS